MKEKLQKKTMLLRLLCAAMVLIAIASVFLPIYTVTKTEKVLGIEETLTANFSIFDMLIMNEKIGLKSNSALGEFKDVLSISMMQLLGGENNAVITMVALIFLAASFVLYAIGILFLSLIGLLPQRGTIRYFVISFSFLTVFPLILFLAIENTDFSLSSKFLGIIGPIIVLAVLFVIMEFLDKFFKEIAAISTEIFLTKYKNESKEWLETFTKDMIEYIGNANISIESESFLRFTDVIDRKELREKAETEHKKQ